MKTFDFVFWDTISLSSPDWPGAHCVDQAGFKVTDLPASASRILGPSMITFVMVCVCTRASECMCMRACTLVCMKAQACLWCTRDRMCLWRLEDNPGCLSSLFILRQALCCFVHCISQASFQECYLHLPPFSSEVTRITDSYARFLYGFWGFKLRSPLMCWKWVYLLSYSPAS